MAELRDTMLHLDGCPDEVPEDLDQFTLWVRKEILELDHSPRVKLAELYQQASEDLAAIEENISECVAGAAAVERRSPKTDADDLDRRFFEHFKKKNLEARDEIVEVLAHRMRREALRLATGPFLPGLWVHPAWSFRRQPNAFSPSGYSPIRHAFRVLPVSELRLVEALYRREDWVGFDRFLADHLERTNPAGEVRRLVTEHHLLARRSDVLLPALDAFDRAELLLFASAVAVQIEGIFEDACILVGIPQDSLRINTLAPKVELLMRHEDSIDFVYYSFRFPVVRNRVAHGRVLEDGDRTARLLLLDLLDACRTVCRSENPANLLVALLRRVARQSATVADALEFAILFVEVNGEQPDPFYGLGESFDEMKLMVEREATWRYLSDLADRRTEEIDAGVRRIAEGLRRHREAVRSDCDELLRRLGNDRGNSDVGTQDFISIVRGLPGSDSPAS